MGLLRTCCFTFYLQKGIDYEIVFVGQFSVEQFTYQNKPLTVKKYLSENPKLVSEWHPVKNGELRSEKFTHGSAKKVWWQCAKVDDHEWEAHIN